MHEDVAAALYPRLLRPANRRPEPPLPDPALQRMPLVRLVDLLAEPPETTPGLVEGRIPDRGLSLLAGKPKAGKSTLARVLALAVARGEPWLGWETVQGRVVYLALEEKGAEVRAHFEAMGATDEDIKVYAAAAPDRALEALGAVLEAERPTLTLVDPLLRFVRLKDANDYAEVTRALEPLGTLARQYGAIVAVHHAGKAERTGGDSILGSTAILGAVDTALILKWGGKYRTLSSIQRYGDQLEEMVLSLDPVTRLVTAGPSRQEAEDQEGADAILAFLGSQAEPVEEAEVLEGVEGRKADTSRLLRQLRRAGRVDRVGGGRRSRPPRP